MGYKPTENYEAKDLLLSGDPEKTVRGVELQADFEAISAAFDDLEDDILDLDYVNTKGDSMTGPLYAPKITSDDFVGGEVTASEFFGDGSNISGITTDQLADVNSEFAQRDDLLIFNGSVWEAREFPLVETDLNFQGGIDLTDPSQYPTAISDGDIYVSNTDGVVDVAWTGIAGKMVNSGNFVGWADSKSQWFLLGDLSTSAVTRVSAGPGIDVDDVKPSEPLVSVDRKETDTWYADLGDFNDLTIEVDNITSIGPLVEEAPEDGLIYGRSDASWVEVSRGGGGSGLWEQNGNDIYYYKGNVGIGETNPIQPLEISNDDDGDGQGQLFIKNTHSLSSGSAGLWLGQSAARKCSIVAERKGTNAHDLVFSTNTGSSDAEEALRITDAGRVGIGTDSPSDAYVTAQNLVLGNHTTDKFSGMTVFSNSTDGEGRILFGDGTAGTDNRVGQILYSHDTDYMAFSTNSAERMRIDAVGNVGIGLTPSAWSTGKAVEIGFQGNALWGNAADEVIVSQNAYYNSGWKYATTRPATHYSQYNAAHRWFTAPSGTANSAITWTQAMTLDASGNLGIGTDDPTTLLSVSSDGGNGDAGQLARFTNTNTSSGTAKTLTIGTDNYFAPNPGMTITAEGGLSLGVGDGSDLAAQRDLTISAAGNVGIGTDSIPPVANYRVLQVRGSSTTNGGMLRLDTSDGTSGVTRFYTGSNSAVLETTSATPITFRTESIDRMVLDTSGRVGIGGTPSRSTKEIEDEAVATLANWDSKHKKPTKAELIKSLTERTIGGGSAKLQVAGDGYFSGQLLAAQPGSGTNAFAAGTNAGLTNQSDNAVAVGNGAANSGQGDNAVAVGVLAGMTTQGVNAVAVGRNAGKTDQSVNTVAVGVQAGETSQGVNAVAIGVKAGSDNQSNYSVAVGDSAGNNTQGAYSVAIGYEAGAINQGANGIIINSSGAAQNVTAANHIYLTSGTGKYLYYNGSTTWELQGGDLVVPNNNVTAIDFIASSDERLKSDITTAPSVVDQLHGREWTWKEDGKKGSGVIAQELEAVLPHLVHEDDEGMKAVSYQGLVAYLIEEVKGLKREIEELKS